MTTRCKACLAKITWIKTLGGKQTPINENGTSHWATCPAAKQFRKTKSEA